MNFVAILLFYFSFKVSAVKQCKTEKNWHNFVFTEIKSSYYTDEWFRSSSSNETHCENCFPLEHQLKNVTFTGGIDDNKIAKLEYIVTKCKCLGNEPCSIQEAYRKRRKAG